MTLGFMQHFPWKENKTPVPTNFREKIICPWVKIYENTYPNPTELFFAPKLHTFREDKHNRWKAGMSIQMVYRGPKYSILDHFNKGIPELEKCVSTQKVKIWYTGYLDRETLDEIVKLNITIDGKRIDASQFDTIAKNDGFKDTLQFCNWFNKINVVWQGKIIHWTDLRY
jgi:hypothetical protein